MSGADRKLERVLAGFEAAVAAGFTPIKLNCVVIRGQNEGSVLALAERFRHTPHVVRFIEYMDVGTQNHWRGEDVITADEMLRAISARWPLEPLPASQGGEVARRYRYSDGGGEIGMIASVSEPFCGSCNRARLSADGRFLTCLFAADGTHLRTLLRAGTSDVELADVMRRTWLARSDRYSEQRKSGAPTQLRRRLEMYQIGG
ncbi:MAG TPA: hypothetical protein VHM19_10960, partial [Polyangiales bacterium]|nr:hypothetical protein [Polyangiales bacterium]